MTTSGTEHTECSHAHRGPGLPFKLEDVLCLCCFSAWSWNQLEEEMAQQGAAETSGLAWDTPSGSGLPLPTGIFFMFLLITSG